MPSQGKSLLWVYYIDLSLLLINMAEIIKVKFDPATKNSGVQGL